MIGASPGRPREPRPSTQPLVKLHNDAIRILKEGREHLAPWRFAKSPRVPDGRGEQDGHPRRLHFLVHGLQILDPEGEMVDADLIQFDSFPQSRPGCSESTRNAASGPASQRK
jgi:hypothetical protein